MVVTGYSSHNCTTDVIRTRTHGKPIAGVDCGLFFMVCANVDDIGSVDFRRHVCPFRWRLSSVPWKYTPRPYYHTRLGGENANLG